MIPSNSSFESIFNWCNPELEVVPTIEWYNQTQLFVQWSDPTMTEIYLCGAANISWRTCVFAKQMQYNPNSIQSRASRKQADNHFPRKQILHFLIPPSGYKCCLKTCWVEVFSTSHEEVLEDSISLTPTMPLWCLFKVFKSSFKTGFRTLFKNVLKLSIEDAFEDLISLTLTTSFRRLLKVFKTSWNRLQDPFNNVLKSSFVNLQHCLMGNNTIRPLPQTSPLKPFYQYNVTYVL